MTSALVELGLETLPLLLLAAALASVGRTGINPRWPLIAILLIVLHELLLTRFL
jgi:hypothetical protein